MTCSGKIRKCRLRIFLITVMGLLCYQEVGVSQVGVGSVSSVPTVDRSVLAEEVTKSPLPSSLVLIGEGDVLEISLYGAPDFKQHVRVAAGEVSLPLIGAVKVQGRSTEEVKRIVEKDLKDKGYYNDPQVTVLQQEFGSSQAISVLGEVMKPGVYPVLSARTLFDMISAAGGITPKSGQDILITHRTEPNKVQKVTRPSAEDKQMEANLDVFPGDIILVTKAPIIYVMGDVRLPGGFIGDKSNGLTIIQALALAQGPTSTAKLDSIMVIHKTENGPKVITTALKKIIDGKESDLPLEADDILFIPHSGAKAAVQSLTTIMQSVAGAAIYHF